MEVELEYDWHLKVAELYDTVDLNLPMPSSSSQRTGAIAEQKFITECLERNFEPHLPVTPMPWDMIVTCFPAKNCYSCVTSVGCENKDYMSHDIDVVGIYVVPEDTWWMIPRNEIQSKTVKLNPAPDSTSKYKKWQDNWSLYYE